MLGGKAVPSGVHLDGLIIRQRKERALRVHANNPRSPQKPHYRPARSRSAPGAGPGRRRARRRTWAVLRPTSRPSPHGEALAGARPFPSNRTGSSARPRPLSEALSSPPPALVPSARLSLPQGQTFLSGNRVPRPPTHVPSEGPSPGRVRPSPASPRRARPALARVSSPPAGRSHASARPASS